MADDDAPDNATVQMTPEQLRRLHAELAGKAKAPRAAAAPPQDEFYAKSEADFVGDEPVEPAPISSRPVKPAGQAPAADGGGGGLLVVGGIGAIIAGLGVALPVVSSFQGMTGEVWPLIGGTIAMVLGHLLVGLGMFGAVSRTNGVAALVGTLHLLAVAGLAFFLLALFGVIQLDGDLVRYAGLAPAILPGTAWLLSGIWGLSAASGAGAMGILHGIFAFLGGAAQLTMVVGALAGLFGRQDDLTYALQLGAPGAILLAAIFLAIAMFGRLRRA